MNNPSEATVKPVLIKAGSQTQSIRYNPDTNLIEMDPINVADLNLRDFTRIHSFFRRIQALRYNHMTQEATEHTNPCSDVFKDPQTFAELPYGAEFKTDKHPHARLQRVGAREAEIIWGSVLLDATTSLQSGVIFVDPTIKVRRP